MKYFLVSAFGLVLELPGPPMLVKDLSSPRGGPRAPEAKEQFLWPSGARVICWPALCALKMLTVLLERGLLKYFYVEPGYDD